ncbi:ABC transporter ATP-binding protein [Chengkuizengella axinellae]|uniref:ATP-binding cassette domain-containing protein n=1 Tax=Chengkuizengella axinellae TaxID=3064388 RepID=A0ABT9J0Q3_9BACL|nr:ATP-binding cassette domain-containing protein [Chengkuizengella sp. 2205SS18-9]MDP5274589.1 ATP-binding cassette domain-containing protein [Chengkuizengella sp. 2205SS18-9]
MAFIEVHDLVKEYKVNIRNKGLIGSIKSLLIPEYTMKSAVDGINFTIEEGETVGFIGPNGAGKSTTVKMLTGILVPTSGSITIGGLSPYKDRKLNTAKLGVVFGQRSQLWWDLPVIDTFDLLKYIYKIPENIHKSNIEHFSEILGLDEFIKQPVRQLSLGQRMRAEIAASLLHNPEIIFFDEPTIGLDVVAKEKIREFVKFINKERNTTMLFTTHDMVDIEKTCDRMIIIDHGKKIYDGTVEEIKDTYGGNRILSVEFGQNYENILMSGLELIEEKGNKKHFKFAKDDFQVSYLIQKLSQQYEILDITVQEPEIDGIIREIYQGGIKLNESLSGVC